MRPMNSSVSVICCRSARTTPTAGGPPGAGCAAAESGASRSVIKAKTWRSTAARRIRRLLFLHRTMITRRPQAVSRNPGQVRERLANHPRSEAPQLIFLDRQIEMRERAVDVRPHHLRRLADVAPVELAVVVDAEQRQADADLVLEDLEQPHHPGRTRRREAIDIK